MSLFFAATARFPLSKRDSNNSVESPGCVKLVTATEADTAFGFFILLKSSTLELYCSVSALRRYTTGLSGSYQLSTAERKPVEPDLESGEEG